MTDELDHLTEDERKTVLSIFPKEIRDLESTNEDSKSESVPNGNEKKSEVDKLDSKIQALTKEEWKDGYLDYEKKTKDSDRISYEDGEIEISEDDY